MSRFSSISETRAAGGLRMACLRGTPSPWTEAAKGIFHVKRLQCLYGAQAEHDVDHAIADWAGDSSIPVVAYRKEKLRTGWAEILLLAERLAPEPALIPADVRSRALMFGLAHEICGEMGLGWCLRLLILKAGMDHSDGRTMPSDVTANLAGKYGFNPSHVAESEDRIVAVLGMLDETLADGEFFLEERLTALDIYWATMANLLSPLEDPELPMSNYMRGVYTTANARLLDGLTPRLKAHQLRIYRAHLELPVPL